MSDLLALDWDTTEVRYVLATATGSRLKVHAVGSRLLVASPDGSTGPAEVGRALQGELSSHRVRRCKVLVGLARNDVEFLGLTMPAVDDSELAELVGHSVLRQSPASAEGATIDFVPLNHDPLQPRVVAAAICPEEVRSRATQVCGTAGLTPSRLLLRPYALVHWVGKSDDLDEASLLVCRSGDDLDLAIVRRDAVTYSRTVRLPRHEEEANVLAGLMSEIRRTMLVAPPHEGGTQPVDRILLFGNTARLAALASRLQEELSLPATVVDPFASVHPSCAIPEDSSSYAPLLGMLHDEVKGTHAFDFQNPRRPPAPPDRRRQSIMIGVILAAILAAGSWHVWDSLGQLDAKIQESETRLRELEQSWKKASRKGAIVQALDSWQASSVNWLDELCDLSARFPSSRDAVVLHLALSPTRDGGGEIDLTGLVRDPEIVRRIESSLRDDFHQLRIPRVQEREMNKNYSWHFESRVLVRPRTLEQYAAHFRGDAAPSKNATAADSAEKTVPVANTAAERAVSRSPAPAKRKKSGEGK